MEIAQLTRELKKTNPAPIYLVAGQEGALVDRALAMITQRVLADVQSADFALTRLEGKSTSADEIEAAARTASLFGGRRLVILKEAHNLKAGELKKLTSYLGEPVSSTTLVLQVRGVGADTRDPKLSKSANVVKKLKKAVEKGKGIYVNCPKPKERDLPRLAEQILKEYDLTASRNGLYALVEAVGEDLGALIQAIEKLSLFLGDQRKIDETHVATVVADTKSQSIFALTDAVGEGSLDRAIRVLNCMLRDGESPLAVIAHLTRHFRNLARVSALRNRGDNVEAIRKKLGLHPFVVKKCMLQVRRFSQAKLAIRLKMLAEADRKIKSARLPNKMQLQNLVVTLCENL